MRIRVNDVSMSVMTEMMHSPDKEYSQVKQQDETIDLINQQIEQLEEPPTQDNIPKQRSRTPSVHSRHSAHSVHSNQELELDRSPMMEEQPEESVQNKTLSPAKGRTAQRIAFKGHLRYMYQETKKTQFVQDGSEMLLIQKEMKINEEKVKDIL